MPRRAMPMKPTEPTEPTKPVYRPTPKWVRCLASFVSLLPSIVFAQPPSGDALGAIPDVDARSGIAHTSDKPLFGDIQAGPLTITLEATTLSAVQQAFGGTIRHRGDAGDSAYWLCYTAVGVQTESDVNADASRVVLFVSSGEMGGATHTLGTVALEPRSDAASLLRNPALPHRQNEPSDGTEDCPTAPMVLQHLDFGMPSVGAPSADVDNLVGQSQGDRYGNRVYTSEYAPPGRHDATTLQTAHYTVRGGRVVGIAVSQVTTN